MALTRHSSARSVEESLTYSSVKKDSMMIVDYSVDKNKTEI